MTDSKKKRIRRTPDEAKALILEVAAGRLAELGLDGLNIAGVAKAAGMSHATVIHHFGSTGAMREALFEKMTTDLLTDVMTALEQHESPEQVLDRLFTTLSQGGHGRLLAWFALDRGAGNPGEGPRAPMFKSILDAIGAEGHSESYARNLVFLVAIAAMGLSISGDSLAQLVGLSEEERRAFPKWMAEHISNLDT